MLAPSYLSDSDRQRLADINQSLLGKNTPEEVSALMEEQREIMGRRKELPQCTYEELQELRAQLFAQYQKHASIGSKQARVMAQYLQQVEFREMMIANRNPGDSSTIIAPKEPQSAASKSKRRVSAPTSRNSWTVDLD